jgi:2-oxoglutarate dehydrogenase E2 component (dihydrolipoamide succinyltransferase)
LVSKVKYMMTQIRAPVVMNTGAKSSIGQWFKRSGDPLTLDEPLVEINTDKQTHEIQASVTGVLSTIFPKDGAFVEAGSVLGTIRQCLIERSVLIQRRHVRPIPKRDPKSVLKEII